jgi:Na+-translocating ferredoxin:NAD+ oxidoreductase subunit A
MEVGYIELAIGSILISNFVLAKFLGFCPFFGVTRKMSDSVGMGLAVVFVMALASAATALVYRHLLLPTSPEHTNVLALLGFSVPQGGYALVLKTVSYILVIAVLVQFVEMVLRKNVPNLYRAMGIYLPLITTNCAVLGVALLNTDSWRDPANGLPLAKATWNGFCGGLGFLLAMILMSSVRERLSESRIPRALRGLPIAFICASLMALSFLGFAKLFGIAV